jgi:hypothetical protein
MAPTYEQTGDFRKDWKKITPAEEKEFRVAVAKFLVDLNGGTGFRSGLRVKGVQTYPGVFELTWAPDGRATFEYGNEIRPGMPHIIWRRIGDHGIFDRP